MGFCERAVELAEAKAKSLKDDEVVVFINTDDLDCLNKASEVINHLFEILLILCAISSFTFMHCSFFNCQASFW